MGVDPGPSSEQAGAVADGWRTSRSWGVPGKLMLISWRNKRVELIGATFTEWFAYGLAVFLILFPKGGLKAGSLPLTWGYGLLGIALIVGVPFWVLSRVPFAKRGTLAALVSLTPVQVLLVYSLFVNGVQDSGFVFSDFVVFFVLPFAFLLVFPSLIQAVRVERLLLLVRHLIFLAAAYGIFLFGWHIATGRYIGIPFLTVNVDDYEWLNTGKANERAGGLFKLISTYNNGNLYGICTLLLLPLFDTLDRSRFRRLLVRLALVLTLSRAVWIGLIVNEGLSILRSLAEDARSFPRIRIRQASLARFAGILLLSLVVLSMTYLFSGASFLFDSSLGGRSSQLEIFRQVSILPSVPLNGFGEIVYAWAASLLGWSGLAAFLLLFGSPVILAASFDELRTTPAQVAACQGLTLYLFLAAMDGAINYLPTMAFYWFLYMLLLNGHKFEPQKQIAI